MNHTRSIGSSHAAMQRMQKVFKEEPPESPPNLLVGNDDGPDSTNREEGWMTHPFLEGEDVLLQATDGLMYFGIIVEVDHEMCQCLVRFGDCTERWSQFYDLRRLGGGGGGDDDGQSGGTSRPSAHAAGVKAEAVKHEAHGDEESCAAAQWGRAGDRGGRKTDWLTPSTTPPPSTASGSSKSERRRRSRYVRDDRVLEGRKELPYDFDALVWDESHQRNHQDRYCYCGESGDWYRKMLQCTECWQWFHRDCIRDATSVPNLLFGDRFYDFVCSICLDSHSEQIIRLDMNYVEALHLALFNLTILNNKKFHDLEHSIIPFLKREWKGLQGPSGLLKSSRIEPVFLRSLLHNKKTRFKAGCESRTGSTFWTLCTDRGKISPPAAHTSYLGSVAAAAAQHTAAYPGGSVDAVGGNGAAAAANEFVGRGQTKHKTSSKSFSKPRRRADRGQPSLLHTGSSAALAIKSAAGHMAAKQRRDVAAAVSRAARAASKSAGSRGRPKKNNHRESMDSSAERDSDTSSSRGGTLDAFIPPPKDFEGENHPFRSRGRSAAAAAAAAAAAHRPSPSSHAAAAAADGDSPSSTSTAGGNGSGLALMMPPPLDLFEMPPTPSGTSSSSSSSAASIASSTIAAITSKTPGRFFSDLTHSLTSFYGDLGGGRAGADERSRERPPSSHMPAANRPLSVLYGMQTRLDRAEKFRLAARRLTLDGDIQYLCEWEHHPLGPVSAAPALGD